MPAMIRTSGQTANPADGDQQDAKAVIPDSSYAASSRGRSPCSTCVDLVDDGRHPNVGRCAQKAEEYGAHDKTFEIEAAGSVRVVDGSGDTNLSSTTSSPATCPRGCQTKDAAVADWGAARGRARPRDRGARRVLARREPRA